MSTQPSGLGYCRNLGTCSLPRMPLVSTVPFVPKAIYPSCRFLLCLRSIALRILTVEVKRVVCACVNPGFCQPSAIWLRWGGKEREREKDKERERKMEKGGRLC